MCLLGLGYLLAATNMSHSKQQEVVRSPPDIVIADELAKYECSDSQAACNKTPPPPPSKSPPGALQVLDPQIQLQTVIKLLSFVEWSVLRENLDLPTLVRSLLSISTSSAKRTLADLSDLAILLSLEQGEAAVTTKFIIVGGIAFPSTRDRNAPLRDEWSFVFLFPRRMSTVSLPDLLRQTFQDDGLPAWSHFLNHVRTLASLLEQLWSSKSRDHTLDCLRYYLVLVNRHNQNYGLFHTPNRCRMHMGLKALENAPYLVVNGSMDRSRKTGFLKILSDFTEVFPLSLELKYSLETPFLPWSISLCSLLVDHLLESLYYCHNRLKGKLCLETDVDLLTAEACVWYTIVLWQLTKEHHSLGNFWQIWQNQVDGIPHWASDKATRVTGKIGSSNSQRSRHRQPDILEDVYHWLRFLCLPLRCLGQLARARPNSLLVETLKARTSKGEFVFPVGIPHQPHPRQTFSFGGPEVLDSLSQEYKGRFDPRKAARLLLHLPKLEEWWMSDVPVHLRYMLNSEVKVNVEVHPEIYATMLTQDFEVRGQ